MPEKNYLSLRDSFYSVLCQLCLGNGLRSFRICWIIVGEWAGRSHISSWSSLKILIECSSGALSTWGRLLPGPGLPDRRILPRARRPQALAHRRDGDVPPAGQEPQQLGGYKQVTAGHKLWKSNEWRERSKFYPCLILVVSFIIKPSNLLKA